MVWRRAAHCDLVIADLARSGGGAELHGITTSFSLSLAPQAVAALHPSRPCITAKSSSYASGKSDRVFLADMTRRC
jgi:hypothetical protein